MTERIGEPIFFSGRVCSSTAHAHEAGERARVALSERHAHMPVTWRRNCARRSSRSPESGPIHDEKQLRFIPGASSKLGPNENGSNSLRATVHGRQIASPSVTKNIQRIVQHIKPEYAAAFPTNGCTTTIAFPLQKQITRSTTLPTAAHDGKPHCAQRLSLNRRGRRPPRAATHRTRDTRLKPGRGARRCREYAHTA